MDALDYLRHLLDPGRLAVTGLVAAAPHTSEELADASGQPLRQVLSALAVLERGGLACRDEHQRWHLEPEELRTMARDLPAPPPPDRFVMAGMTAQEQAVLARFFTGRRLTEIPAAQAKRRVVLQRIALEFEPGRHYAEADVNAVLTAFHEDYAALRRYLVDDGLLDRSGGEYWRSGGRVDV